jgi:hypothetical protein
MAFVVRTGAGLPIPPLQYAMAFFLFSVIGLLGSTLHQLRSLGSPDDIYRGRRGSRAVVGLLMFAGALSITGARILHAFVGFIDFIVGKGPSGDDHTPYSWLLGVGAALAAPGFAHRLLLAHQSAKALPLDRAEVRRSVGVCVLGLILALYVGSVAVDQFRFYRSSRSFGTFADSRYTPLPWITDLKCKGARAQRVVFTDLEAAEVRYRCTRKNLWTFASWGNTPMLPWPFYTQGRSATAGAAIRRHFYDRTASQRRGESSGSARGEEPR